VKTIQTNIESLEDTLKPVVLKKLKVIEHELIQTKVKALVLVFVVTVVRERKISWKLKWL
jgi:hypothetical protein